MNSTSVSMKYVGFCDILGFSSAVLKDFDITISVYKELKYELSNM
jgi:hypothetical protein